MERTYKKIEIVGSSEISFAEATQNAVAKACRPLRHIDWFEVTVVNRQTDRLVEVFDACAAHALRFTAIRLGMFRKNHLCLAPRSGTTVALEVV